MRDDDVILVRLRKRIIVPNLVGRVYLFFPLVFRRVREQRNNINVFRTYIYTRAPVRVRKNYVNPLRPGQLRTTTTTQNIQKRTLVLYT
jgi:hypothetical protein